MTAKKRPEDYLPLGRPTKYRPEYNDQAFKYCLLGATDADLAVFFEVNEDTINEWKIVHLSFSESLKNGRERADANVAHRLYNRATGYDYTEETVSRDGIVELRKHAPPDPASMAIWLKNRRPKQWRDRPQEDKPTQTPQDVDTLKAEIRKLVEDNGFHV